MAAETVTHLDDERVRPYRNVKDNQLARDGRRFIAEGLLVVERLMASDLTVESVFVASRCVDTVQSIVPNDVPLYVADEKLLRDIVGFDFHRGVLACGVRPTPPTLNLLLSRHTRDNISPMTVLVVPQVNELDNLGAIMRIAAGFGVDALLLGPQCCDPFWRRAVRVSMGTVFTLPIRQSDDLQRDLTRLRDEWDVQCVGAVCDDDAESLRGVQRPANGRIALLLGREDRGLEPVWLDLCDRRVTIPMHLGTDSLNVAIAAAVCLYELTNDQGRTAGGT